MSFSGAFSKGWSWPQIQNGYLISYRSVIQTGPASDTVRLYELDTGKEAQLSFWLAGASTIWVNDVAITLNREILAAGSFLQPSDGSIHNFVARLSMTGYLLGSTDLGEYEPERICGTADGGYWTLGQKWSAEAAGTPYHLVKSFDGNGKLKKSYLPRANLDTLMLNFSGRPQSGIPPMRGVAVIRCAGNSVGAYIGPAKQWFEIGSATAVPRVWPVKLPASRVWQTGLAYLGYQRVYASFNTYPPLTSGDPPFKAASRGLYTLDFSGDSVAVWEPVLATVTLSSQTGSILSLIGSDGSNLVFRRLGVKRPNGTPILSWVLLPGH